MTKKVKKKKNTGDEISLFSEITGIIILLFTIVLFLSLISYTQTDSFNYVHGIFCTENYR